MVIVKSMKDIKRSQGGRNLSTSIDQSKLNKDLDIELASADEESKSGLKH
jgi:hypothetical protein